MNQIKPHYISVFISAVCLIRQTSKIIAKNCGNSVPGVGRNRYTLDTLYPFERVYAVNGKQASIHMCAGYVNDQLRSAGNSTVEWAYLQQTVLVFCFCSVDKHLINKPP